MSKAAIEPQGGGDLDIRCDILSYKTCIRAPENDRVGGYHEQRSKKIGDRGYLMCVDGTTNIMELTSSTCKSG